MSSEKQASAPEIEPTTPAAATEPAVVPPSPAAFEVCGPDPNRRRLRVSVCLASHNCCTIVNHYSLLFPSRFLSLYMCIINVCVCVWPNTRSLGLTHATAQMRAPTSLSRALAISRACRAIIFSHLSLHLSLPQWYSRSLVSWAYLDLEGRMASCASLL